MAEVEVDLALLGGGLAGGLIALAVAARHPGLRVAVVERSELGGNHVWSHFASDVDDRDAWLVQPLVSYAWPSYDVVFPQLRRELAAPYRSLTSERLAAVLRDALAPPQPARRATRPTLGSQRRRVEAKKRRGHTKRLRGSAED